MAFYLPGPMEVENVFMNVSETDSITSYECECGYKSNRKANLHRHKRNCIAGVSEDKDDTIESLQNEVRQLKERLEKQKSKMVEYEKKILVLETEARLKEVHRTEIVNLLRATPVQQPIQYQIQQPVQQPIQQPIQQPVQQPAELAKTEKMTPVRFMKERCNPIGIVELLTGISKLTRDEMNCFILDGHVDGHCHVIDMVIKKLKQPIHMRPFHGIITHKGSALYIKTARIADPSGDRWEETDTWQYDDTTLDSIILRCRIECLKNIHQYKLDNPLPKRIFYDEDDPDNETENNKEYMRRETFGCQGNNNEEIHDWVDAVRNQVASRDDACVKQIIKQLKNKYELTMATITLCE